MKHIKRHVKVRPYLVSVFPSSTDFLLLQEIFSFCSQQNYHGFQVLLHLRFPVCISFQAFGVAIIADIHSFICNFLHIGCHNRLKWKKTVCKLMCTEYMFFVSFHYIDTWFQMKCLSTSMYAICFNNGTNKLARIFIHDWVYDFLLFARHSNRIKAFQLENHFNFFFWLSENRGSMKDEGKTLFTKTDRFINQTNTTDSFCTQRIQSAEKLA